MFFSHQSLKKHNKQHESSFIQKCLYCEKIFGQNRRSVRRHLKVCKLKPAKLSGHLDLDIDALHKNYFLRKETEYKDLNGKKETTESTPFRIPILGFAKSTPPKYRDVGHLTKKKHKTVNFF